MKADFVQPRHNYAPLPEKEATGHVYLPTSLLTAGARLIAAGVDVAFHDENLRPANISSHIVGINLLGAPYVPEVIRMQREMAEGEHTYLLGGQVVSGLADPVFHRWLGSDAFHQLFGDRACNGNDDALLTKTLELTHSLLPPWQTSLIPAYERISDDDMRHYLSKEISVYVSQGCKYACDFCSAVRTTRNPVTGHVAKVQEQYRDLDIVRQDIAYLARRAARLGLTELNMYMSNLDVFQTPGELLRFARAIQDVKAENRAFNIRLRGLSTVESFLRARDRFEESIEAIVAAGFHTVGFGIDGMTAEVWRKVNKKMNTEDKCLNAIRYARECGLTPEGLMVFGHADADTERTLHLAREFTLAMVEEYGMVPRPHLSKLFVPGNNRWREPETAHVRSSIRALMDDPAAFQGLDFTAIGSHLTHEDAELRLRANENFLRICDIPGNTTQYVEPIIPGMTQAEIERVKEFNEGRYDR